jgi:cell division septum initiation protein DivIVA
MKLLIENWRRYLNEYGEMPPKGHMPPPAGYSWSDETREFYDNVENLYSRYKIEKDIGAFKTELSQLWRQLSNKGHRVAVLNQLTDKAEREKDAEADDFENVYLDITMEMYQ